MRPSDKGLDEFRRIYEREFGRTIGLEEAKEMVTRLLTLYELFARLKPEDRPKLGPPQEISGQEC